MPDATETYEVISLDVWGNECDGYDINAAYTTGRRVELPVDCYDAATVLRACLDAGEITQVEGGSVEFSEDSIYVNEEETGRPVLELQIRRE
jgi:hypothetical protein